MYDERVQKLPGPYARSRATFGFRVTGAPAFGLACGKRDR